jgi:hypothetical protein
VIDLGEAVLRQGKLAEAERYRELGEELLASEDVDGAVALALLRAKIGAARTDLGHAEEIAREAVDASTKTDYLERTADAWLTLAGILRARATPPTRRPPSRRSPCTNAGQRQAGWAQRSSTPDEGYLLRHVTFLHRR